MIVNLLLGFFLLSVCLFLLDGKFFFFPDWLPARRMEMESRIEMDQLFLSTK